MHKNTLCLDQEFQYSCRVFFVKNHHRVLSVCSVVAPANELTSDWFLFDKAQVLNQQLRVLQRKLRKR